MVRYTFPKEERLKNAKQIAGLFESGRSLLVYPVKVVWVTSDHTEDVPVKVAFTVSKKNFRHAVMRNLLKRRMREAYRLNRHLLAGDLNETRFRMVFVYIAREALPFGAVSKSIAGILLKISRQ